MNKRLPQIGAIMPMYIFTMVFVLGPLIYMVVFSFMTRGDQWGVIADFTTENYKRIFEPLYLDTFIQSIKLALTTTIIVILIGYPCGYFMAKLSPKWRTKAVFLLIIPFWTSSLMRIYGWMIIFRANGILDRFLMWTGITDEPLKLMYTYPAVVVGMVYALVPFMIYAVYASTEKMDWSLVEASRDLGAGKIKAFTSVSLPQTMPGLFSGVVLTFTPSMGLYYISEILGGNKVVLVGNLIYSEMMKAHDWPFAAALSVALMLITTIFLFAYRKATNSSQLEGLI